MPSSHDTFHFVNRKLVAPECAHPCASKRARASHGERSEPVYTEKNFVNLICIQHVNIIYKASEGGRSESMCVKTTGSVIPSTQSPPLA